MTRWRLHTIGKTAHSSLPDLGDNAIYQMISCVQQIVAAYEPILSSRSHPLLDKPTLTVNTIHGGTAVNIVPGSCVIEIDRRVLPNEDYSQITPELHRIVEVIQENFPALNVEIEDPFEEIPGIDSPIDSEVVQVATKIAGDMFGHPERRRRTLRNQRRLACARRHSGSSTWAGGHRPSSHRRRVHRDSPGRKCGRALSPNRYCIPRIGRVRKP